MHNKASGESQSIMHLSSIDVTKAHTVIIDFSDNVATNQVILLVLIHYEKKKKNTTTTKSVPKKMFYSVILRYTCYIFLKRFIKALPRALQALIKITR